MKKEAQHQVGLPGFRRQPGILSLEYCRSPFIKWHKRLPAVSVAQVRKASAVPKHSASSPAAGAIQFGKSYTIGGKRC